VGKISHYQKQMVKALKYIKREAEVNEKKIPDLFFLKELSKNLKVQCIRKKKKKAKKDLTD